MDVSYYLHDFWNDYGDKKVSTDFPLMTGGPWQVLALCALYAFLALKVGPMFMRDRKPYDLRPWMLVFNGFMFGVNGAGFLIALWVTQLGTNSWSCSDENERWEGVQGIATKYMGMTYLGIKLFDFMTTAFEVLRKREHVDVKSQVLHNSFLVLYAFVGLKFYPKGIFCHLPLLDTFFQSIRCAYLVLASAGSALRFSLWWKNYVTMSVILQQVLLITHSLYFLLTPNCAGPTYLKAMVLMYALPCLSYNMSVLSRGTAKISRRD